MSGISDMGMIEVGPTRTYTLAEFCTEQSERIQKLDNKLLEFRNLLRETVYDACRYHGYLTTGFDILRFVEALSLMLGSVLMSTQLS